jgi:WD40 repeat protein
VLFSVADDRLATASNDGGVYLWNAASGAYEREMGVETDHLGAEAFSPASDVLATANDDDDDTVQLRDCTTGRHIRTFADHSGRVRSIAFNPTAQSWRPAAMTGPSACGTLRRVPAWPR